MELSSVNELLDRIAALGVAMDYDRIGLKPDQREINSPSVTHHVVVVEERGIPAGLRQALRGTRRDRGRAALRGRSKSSVGQPPYLKYI